MSNIFLGKSSFSIRIILGQTWLTYPSFCSGMFYFLWFLTGTWDPFWCFLILFRHSVGTRLDEWGARRKSLYLHGTKHRNTMTNIHAISGTRTHDHTDQAIRPHGHWYCYPDFTSSLLHFGHKTGSSIRNIFLQNLPWIWSVSEYRFPRPLTSTLHISMNSLNTLSAFILILTFISGVKFLFPSSSDGLLLCWRN
jgi:hypothetical protein